jgi:hypothetical protein
VPQLGHDVARVAAKRHQQRRERPTQGVRPERRQRRLLRVLVSTVSEIRAGRRHLVRLAPREFPNRWRNAAQRPRAAPTHARALAGADPRRWPGGSTPNPAQRDKPSSLPLGGSRAPASPRVDGFRDSGRPAALGSPGPARVSQQMAQCGATTSSRTHIRARVGRRGSPPLAGVGCPASRPTCPSLLRPALR